MFRFRTLFGISLLILSALAQGAEVRTVGAITFEKCIAEGLSRFYSAWCADFTVPENHAGDSSRDISVALTWLPAKTTVDDATPIVFLAGGPGQGARESYPSLRSAFYEMNENHPILLIDQRGTGNSGALHCDFGSLDAPVDNDPEYLVQMARDCRAEFSEVALQHYTTDDAAQDIELVRQALKVPQLVVYGVSYGTRLAQRYAALYPDHLRALILDSAVPSQLVLLAEHGRSLDAALEGRFAACGSQSDCAESLGTIGDTLERLLDRVETGAPSEVSFRDSQTGMITKVNLSRDHLVSVLRLLSYQSETAAMLPQLIANAESNGFADFVALSDLLLTPLVQSIAHGLQLSVICSETMPYLTPANTAGEEETLLGTQLIEITRLQCQEWPSKPIAEDFFSPPEHTIPTLILAGEFDPVTPAAYGRTIAEDLENATLIVVPDEGHAVIGIGCLEDLAAEFVANLSIQSTRCIDEWQGVPMFSGPHGWSP